MKEKGFGKKLLSLFLVLSMMLTLIPTSTKAATLESTDNYYKIVHLDCGRKYFTKDWILSLIDEMAKDGYTHLELAFGNDGMRFLLDDMSLEINGNSYSSDRVKAAIQQANRAYYDAGTYNELTEAEVDEIITYAKNKKIEIIPLLNTPGHMNAILDAMEILGFSNVKYNGSDSTIDITNTTAINFLKAFVNKYIQYFAIKESTIFNIGADEFANDIYEKAWGMGFGTLITNGHYDEFGAYIKELAALVRNANMKPMAFNDGMYFNENTSVSFDNDILIAYWSSGWGTYPVASAQYLKNKGFTLINTHGDFYYVLGKNDNFDSGSSYASNWDNKKFMGTTFNEEQAGAMFCIWCDYPNAETEAQITTKVINSGVLSALSSAMGHTVSAGNGTVNSPYDLTNSLNSNVLSTMTVGSELYVTLGEQATWTVEDETIITITNGDSKITTLSQELSATTIKVNAEKLGNTTLTATTASGTTNYDIEVVDVIYEDGGIIEVTVGSKETLYIDGDYTVNDVDKTLLDSTIATIVANQSSVDSEEITTTEVASITSGNSYLITIGTNGKLLTNFDGINDNTGHNNVSGIYLKGSITDSSFDNMTWTIVTTSGGYYVQDENGYYLTIGPNTASLTNKPTLIGLNYNKGTWTINDGSYYLNQFGGKYSNTAAGWTGIDDGSQWKIYQLNNATENKLQLEVTGESIGSTYVVVGNKKYTIKVVEDTTLNTNDTITIEYWITNTHVFTEANGKGSNSYILDKNDADVASKKGVELSTILPTTGYKSSGNSILEYWRTRVLDKTEINNSENGTGEQTTIQGDDETNNGSLAYYIRFYDNIWQYSTDRTSWHVLRDQNQIVAYYMELTQLANEVKVTIADWGLFSNELWGYYPDANKCTLSVQVVYEDKSTFPIAETSDILGQKPYTFIYGYWENGRGIGTLNIKETGDYLILKVTSETGEATFQTNPYSSNDGSVSINGFKWDNNEMTVWEENSAENGITISNDAHNPSKENFYENLLWDENNESILIRIYVKAKPKESNLHVYYREGNSANYTDIYNYDINVSDKYSPNTFEDFNTISVGNKLELTNNAITNALGKTQTVQYDLTNLSEVGDKYSSGYYQFTSMEKSKDNTSLYLYYTAGNSDFTYVVDFGLPVTVHMSDLKILNTTNVSNVTISKGTYGKFTIAEDNTSFTYNIDSIVRGREVSTVTVNYKDNTSTTYTVVFIPATTIYYEESVLSFSDSQNATDTFGKWTTNHYGSGINVEQALESLGEKKNNYGYDDAYNTSSMYSLGTVAKVTVDKTTAGTKSVAPYVEFKFTGTGFDLISLTDNTTGTVVVQITGVTDTTFSKNISVDTYYGYTFNNETQKWETNNDVNNSIYQVPVVNAYGLPYGTYNVKVLVSYMNVLDHNKTDEGYTFYMDGVRIYNTLGETDIYNDDNEGYPIILELRDQLISADSFNANNLTGAVFIDGIGETTSVADYKNYGPNNEVYLYQNQAVAFKLDLTGISDNVSSVQLGLKSANGNNVIAKIYNAEQISNSLENTLTTSTDMYYDITSLKNGTIVIRNTGDGILSITNIKLTFNQNPYGIDASNLIVNDEESIGYALRSLSYQAPTIFTPDLFKATLEETVEVGTNVNVNVTTSKDVEYIYVNDLIVATYVDGETTRTFTTTIPTTKVGKLEVYIKAYNVDGLEAETQCYAEVEVTEKTFTPKTFKVSVVDTTLVGSKVKVTVTTSKDVKFITVNNEKITNFKTNKFTNINTWTTYLTANKAGKLQIDVTSYNNESIASNTITEIVTVKNIINIIIDIIGWIFG